MIKYHRIFQIRIKKFENILILRLFEEVNVARNLDHTGFKFSFFTLSSDKPLKFTLGIFNNI